VWASADDPEKLEIVCAVGLKRGCREEISISSEEVRETLRSKQPVHLKAETGLLGRRTFGASHPLALVLPSLTFGGVTGVTKQYVLVLAKDANWTELDMEVLDITNSQISVAISHAAILSNLKAQNEELEGARKAAEAGLRAREEFLAIVSHEMRTPLHAVLAIASVLQQSPSLCLEDLEMVTTISTSAGLLSVLIDDVLDMSRINRGDFQLRIAHFDLASLVKQASKMIDPMAREAGLMLVTEAPNLPEWVVGDGKRTMQMFLNLLTNAVKFTKTRVIFRVWEAQSEDHPDHQIRVDVIDDGIGIEKREIGSLCDRFRQLESGRKAGGMGLGLSICRHLARLMSGAVWLDSPGKGSGTTASILIRLKRISSDERRSIARRRESVGSLRGLRVLVVDDNGVNRLVTCKMLGKLGCIATSADSGSSCLRMVERERFDVCLMDLTMPGMDGFETVSRLWRLEQSKRPGSVVALTADQRLETVSRCLEVGMDGVMTKPATLETLRDSLLEHLASESKRR
jgi:ethylene receptor